MEPTELQKENLLNAETRAKLAGRIEVLDKVKALFLLPKLDMMTVEQVADYYEIDKGAIKVCYGRNKEEIDSDGTEKLTSKALIERELQDVTHAKYQSHTDFQLSDSVVLRVPNVGVRLFSKRAILRIGMLLRDSPVAREVRTQLLNTFEHADEAQRTQEILNEQQLYMNFAKAAIEGSKDDLLYAAKDVFDYKNRHIQSLREKIESDAPAVAFARDAADSAGTTSIGDFAKVLFEEGHREIGRGRLFRLLRQEKILDGSNLPYQKYLDAGWFEVIEVSRSGRLFKQTRITGKGQQKLHQRLFSS